MFMRKIILKASFIQEKSQKVSSVLFQKLMFLNYRYVKRQKYNVNINFTSFLFCSRNIIATTSLKVRHSSNANYPATLLLHYAKKFLHSLYGSPNQINLA